MRSLLLALALLIFGWAAPADASYEGYYYGAKNPGVIADLVERSLARDPTGKTMLDAAKCRKSGSCAAPINYIESFRAHDPQGEWTLENLATKLRQLKIDCSVKGKYQMDRIVLGSGSLGRTDVNGMSRYFHKGECAWVNPETGRPVLAQNCANPVGQRIDIVCVIINFENRQQAEHAVAWERIRKKSDECFAYREVSRLYEPGNSGTPWQAIKPGCIGKPCDFGPYNRTFGYTQASQGMIPLRPGFHQIRLSPDEIVALCLKYGRAQSSFTAGVRWRQDYRMVRGEWHARVYYQTSEMFAAALKISEPKGLAFWASTKEDEARMRGSYSR